MLGGDAGTGCMPGLVPSFQDDVNTDCPGRAYSDVSAIANPNEGLNIDTPVGWMQVGGTSLATPVIASYYALLLSRGDTNLTTPAWAYSTSGQLNYIHQANPAVSAIFHVNNNSTFSDPTSSSIVTPQCAVDLSTPLCSQQPSGWSGQTGMGSISGDVVTGAPGIGSNGYIVHSNKRSVRIMGGVYTNNENTHVFLQYGKSRNYKFSTRRVLLLSHPGVNRVGFTIPKSIFKPLKNYRIVAVNGSGRAYGYNETVG
jgi:subtilase family serine protease